MLNSWPTALNQSLKGVTLAILFCGFCLIKKLGLISLKLEDQKITSGYNMRGTYFFRRIQNTLIALLIVSTLIPVIIVGGYSVSYSVQTITDLSLDKIEQKTADSAARVGTFLDSISKDILYLADTPPVKGIVRAREGGWG